MPYNVKSMKNLSRSGSKPGKKKRITTSLVKEMTDYLDTSFEYFISQMHSLSPKDFCELYLKLIKLVIPKKPEMNTDPTEKPVFIIQLASEQPENKE